MNRVDKAMNYFSQNYNCSQCVFTAYATQMGVDEKLALKIATNFGGGARKGELCGAVSGALMALGLRAGHCDYDDVESKEKSYMIATEYMNRFIAANGTCVCRELLGYDLSKPEEMKIIKEKGLFTKTCPEMVRSAANILEEMISEGIC